MPGQAGARRSPLRRVGRWALAAFLLLLALPPFYVAWRTPPAPAVEVPPPPGERHRVWVVGWGYHTSIVIEQPAGWRLGPPGREGARFVEFAWGDRAFYMEADHRPHTAFAALLLPTESVVYVEGWDALPDRRAGARDIFAREVSAEQLRRLVVSLERSFVRSPGGARAAPHPAVPYYRGRFHPGREFYLFWYDCNAWTVARLHEAGLAGSARGVFLEQQVPWRLRGFRRVRVDGG